MTICKPNKPKHGNKFGASNLLRSGEFASASEPKFQFENLRFSHYSKHALARRVSHVWMVKGWKQGFQKVGFLRPHYNWASIIFILFK